MLRSEGSSLPAQSKFIDPHVESHKPRQHYDRTFENWWNHGWRDGLFDEPDQQELTEVDYRAARRRDGLILAAQWAARWRNGEFRPDGPAPFRSIGQKRSIPC